MSKTTKKQLTLLQVWSRTYLLSLLLGIIVVGLLAVQWMKFSTEQNRLHTIQHITERMAEKVVSDKGEFVSSNEFYKLLRDSQKDLEFKNPIRGHVKSADQRIVYPAPPSDGDPPQGGPAGGGPRNGPPPGGNGARDPLKGPPGEGNPDGRIQRPEPPVEMFDGLLPKVSSYVKKKDEEGLSIFMFSAPITYNDTIIGGMYMSIPSDEVTHVKVDYGMLFLLLAGGALLGWGMIYLLTRRLIKPIKEVADAAKQLMIGNYDVTFQSNSKEQEIAQLITARRFKRCRTG